MSKVLLLALCCARGAVRYVFAVAGALVALWALAAPGLAGMGFAKVLDTPECEHLRPPGCG